MVVERHVLELAVRAARKSSKSGGLARSSSTATMRGIGSALSASVCPSHGSSSWAESATLSARAARSLPLQQKAGDVADELVDVAAVLHLDLHRHLAGDVAQPGEATGSSCRRRRQ
jgi:hypothetical protein